MEKLTYQAYCADPEIRARLDEEVREMRHAAFRRFIVRPIVAFFSESTNLVSAAFSLRPTANHRDFESNAR